VRTGQLLSFLRNVFLREAKELRTLSPYLGSQKKSLLLGFAGVLLGNALSVLIPLVVKGAVDYLSGGGPRRTLAYYAAAILALSIGQGIFRFLTRREIIGASRRIEYALRNDLFRHLEGLSVSFYLRVKVGDIMARATNDLNAVRMMLGPGVMHLANTIIVLAFALTLMVYMNAVLTVVVLLPLVLLAFFVRRFGRLVHVRFTEVQENFSLLSDFVQESLSGIRVTKAFVREEARSERLAELSLGQKNKNLSLVRVWSLFLPSISLAAGLSLATLLWLGGRWVIAGKLSLGELVAFTGYLSLLVWPLTALGWVINLLERGRASLMRIVELLNEKPEITGPRLGGVKRIDDKASVVFDGVSFRYPGSKGWALNEVSLEVGAGETVALVGPTGSGKSTLLSLLPRLFDPTEGVVLIGGKDLRSFDLAVLRRAIGYVPQESFLFSETILENVAFGLDAPEEEKVVAAASWSQLLEEIEAMPRGWETPVGERGVTLSGGQRQRAALARALAIDPQILILDDAFSSVDLKTERGILDYLFGKPGWNRTTFLITHRVSVAAAADRVLVLDRGRLVDQGVHSELLRRCEVYRDLYEKQLLSEELERT